MRKIINLLIVCAFPLLLLSGCQANLIKSAFVLSDGKVCKFDPVKKEIISELKLSQSPIQQYLVSPDEQHIATRVGETLFIHKLADLSLVATLDLRASELAQIERIKQNVEIHGASDDFEIPEPGSAPLDFFHMVWIDTDKLLYHLSLEELLAEFRVYTLGGSSEEIHGGLSGNIYNWAISSDLSTKITHDTYYGGPVQLNGKATKVTDAWTCIALSGDGKYIAYNDITHNPDIVTLWLYDVEKETAEKILDQDDLVSTDFYFNPFDNSKLAYYRHYSADRKEREQLIDEPYWVDLKTKKMNSLPVAICDIVWIDATRFIMNIEGDLHIYDTNNDKSELYFKNASDLQIIPQLPSSTK